MGGWLRPHRTPYVAGLPTTGYGKLKPAGVSLFPVISFLRLETNPVLLYELRQLVRNRLITLLLVIYLITMVIVLGGGLLFSEHPIIEYVLSHENSLGSDVQGFRLSFAILCIFYGFTTGLLILFGSFRLATDRIQEHAVLNTTLSPWRVLSGKLQFGFVIGFLFLSMTLPFLSATYLLRGVDARIILFGAFVLFGMTQCHYALALAFLSGVKTIYQAVGRAVPMLLLQFLAGFFFYQLLITVVNHELSKLNFDNAVLFPGLILSIAYALLALLGLVQLSPENSNRMLPFRVALTIFYAVVCVLILASPPLAAFFETSYPKETEIWYWAFWGSYVLLGYFIFPCFVLIFICERNLYSPRIRQMIPASLGKRLMLFTFYTGAANAIVWSILLLCVKLCVAAVYCLVAPLTPSRVYEPYLAEAVWTNFSSNFLFLDYALTTLLLYNILFHRWMQRHWVWIPLAALALVFIAFFFFVIFFGHLIGIRLDSLLESIAECPFLPIPWEQDHPWHEEEYLVVQISFAAVWFLLLCLVGFRWMLRHVKDFQPHS